MFSRIRRSIKEYRELKYLAYHDSLTGLLNRNWLYKNMNFIKHKYVFFIDINNLHEINKQGHTEGDRYIKQIIKSIILQPHEILVRYAGDEFILFSNNKNAIRSNRLYCVGMAIAYYPLEDSIMEADREMLKCKK